LKSLEEWEKVFTKYLEEQNTDDASHDLSHFQRVFQCGLKIASFEKKEADLFVILAAAYFHDIVSLPKNDPENHKSSHYAAIKAENILEELKFPKEKIKPVCHAILTHSFSANIPPETLEAKIIQDADRMEALGALGVMRTFYISGRLGTKPYHKEDPLAKSRTPDDKLYALDHFFVKLLKLPQLLNTEGGKHIASERTDFLNLFAEKTAAQDSGANIVIEACFTSGKVKAKLFDFKDPFGLDRKLETQTYALDKIQMSETPFIQSFLEQLKTEITSNIQQVADK